MAGLVFRINPLKTHLKNIAMSLETIRKECRDIINKHTLLAAGISAGTAQVSSVEELSVKTNLTAMVVKIAGRYDLDINKETAFEILTKYLRPSAGANFLNAIVKTSPLLGNVYSGIVTGAETRRLGKLFMKYCEKCMYEGGKISNSTFEK